LVLKKEAKIKVGVLLLFFLFTTLQLIPLSLHPRDSVNEVRDSLLNTWILHGVSERLFSNPLELFEANAFYPHQNTLSFSEHMLPQALLFFPISYFSRNPILGYNFVFFLSYLLNGYAMFLLVRYLTKNNTAGVVCGIIFAFNTYQIQHISHLQLLSSGLIPLSFLYLHKFFEDRSLKNSVLFSLFFTLQALSSIYYGLFFLSILVIVLPLLLFFHHRKINISFLLKLGSPLIISGLVLLIFSLPYLSVFKDFGFKRPLTKGADLVNYLSVMPHNVFLKKILNPLGSYEYFLFPGIAALLLSGFCLYYKRSLFKNIPRSLKIFVTSILVITSGIIMIILLTGGFTLNLGLFAFSAHNVIKPAFLLLTVIIIYVIFSFFISYFASNSKKEKENFRLFLYLILFFWALLLSFGGAFTFLGHSTSSVPLPFKWLHSHALGFKGIRVPSRYAIFVIFSIALLAGQGLKILSERITKKKVRIYLAVALIIFLNLEYLSIPQRIRFVPVKKDIPPTYTWLKTEPDDFPVIELPFFRHIGDDAIYMYFSLFHKKKIVNGYSGFIPPAIDYIRKVFKKFPSWACTDILKTLKVEYAILHMNMWEEKERKKVQQRLKNKFSKDYELTREFKYNFSKSTSIDEEFGHDLIYKVYSGKKEKKNKRKAIYTEVPSPKWKIKASKNREHVSFLKDNKMETNWSTGRNKKTGDFLLVELRRVMKIAKVSFFLEANSHDYALNMKVETSLDGKDWKKIKYGYFPGEFTENLIYSPQQPVQNIYLNRKKIRFLKITQVGHDRTFFWSVAEMRIYTKKREKQDTKPNKSRQTKRVDS